MMQPRKPKGAPMVRAANTPHNPPAPPACPTWTSTPATDPKRTTGHWNAPPYTTPTA